MNANASLSNSNVRLEIGHSCYRNLTWECVGGTRDQAVLLTALLPKLGYADESYDDAVRIFVSPEEHTIVLIPRTGRIQIRIHYLTPAEARKVAAERVMLDLSRALAR